jgi:hypothetical protein
MRPFARVLFSVAALFNFAVAAALWFRPSQFMTLLQLDPVTGTNIVLVKIAAGAIAIFGYAYWRVAGDPQTFRPFIGLGVIGKLAVVMIAASSWWMGEIGWQLPGLAGGDLLFAALFLDYLRRTRTV